MGVCAFREKNVYFDEKSEREAKVEMLRKYLDRDKTPHLRPTRLPDAQSSDDEEAAESSQSEDIVVEEVFEPVEPEAVETVESAVQGEREWAGLQLHRVVMESIEGRQESTERHMVIETIPDLSPIQYPLRLQEAEVPSESAPHSTDPFESDDMFLMLPPQSPDPKQLLQSPQNFDEVEGFEEPEACVESVKSIPEIEAVKPIAAIPPAVPTPIESIPPAVPTPIESILKAAATLPLEPVLKAMETPPIQPLAQLAANLPVPSMPDTEFLPQDLLEPLAKSQVQESEQPLEEVKEVEEVFEPEEVKPYIPLHQSISATGEENVAESSVSTPRYTDLPMRVRESHFSELQSPGQRLSQDAAFVFLRTRPHYLRNPAPLLTPEYLDLNFEGRLTIEGEEKLRASIGGSPGFGVGKSPVLTSEPDSLA